MSIELNMYQGHMMTAKDDAVVYEPMLGGNGILYGCELTHLGANQVHINAGDGVIKGRKFTVLEETLNVILPETDGLAGRIYIRMDLSDTNEPIKILSVCAAAILPDLEQDEECNHNNGVYEIELATYTGNRSAITDLKSTYLNVSSRMEMFEQKMNGEIDTLKKSVADGKASIASAITEKGVQTSQDAAFESMSKNIKDMATKQYNQGKKDGIITIPQITTASWSGGTDGTDTHASVTLNCVDKTRLTIGTISNNGAGSHSCNISTDKGTLCTSISASNLSYDITGASWVKFDVGASGGNSYSQYTTAISNITIS